jgi:hypothetical protein
MSFSSERGRALAQKQSQTYKSEFMIGKKQDKQDRKRQDEQD